MPSSPLKPASSILRPAAETPNDSMRPSFVREFAPSLRLPSRLTNRAAVLLAALSLAVGARTLAAQQTAPDTIPASVTRAAQAHAQPGDRIFVHVWREPKLTDTVLVDERGEVMLPKIGIVNATSLTIGSFRDTVRSRFARYLKDSP